ncbi:MAG: hypothetical protein WBI53_07310 [Paludibacter sp.]
MKSFKSILVIFIIYCFSYSGQIEKGKMKSDYQSIKIILDSAIVSDEPNRKFREALPKVKQFSTVDSAWINSSSFFVKFKKGGTVTWMSSNLK